MPRFPGGAVALLVVVGACLLGASCATRVVWREHLPSPRGRYTATAETLQSGGDGDNWITTTVYLEQTNIRRTRMTVLSFFCRGPVPRPYTLDNEANAGGTIHLAMKWLTPSHLEVTYDGRGAKLNFQAVRYQGIDISLKDVAASAPTPTS